MIPLIEAQCVSRTHPRRRGRAMPPPAVDGIDLALHAGDTVALIGDSGGGKSTLARLLAGLETPTGGVVRWSGVDLAALGHRGVARRRPRHVQLIWQDPYATLDPRATVRATLTESIAAHDRALDAPARRARLHALLGQVGLAAAIERRVEMLSGGERRRLAVARALAARPAVLIADEPTTGLDPVLKAEIVELIEQAVAPPHGPTLVLITHDLDVARRLCRRIYALSGGRIVECLAADEAPPPGGYIDRMVRSQRATHLPSSLVASLLGHAPRRGERGVATLEYIVALGAAMLFLGALFHALGRTVSDYLEFALWWLSHPLH